MCPIPLIVRLGDGDHYSVIIIIDEGEPETEIDERWPNSFGTAALLLVIMISLKAGMSYIYESYRFANPRMKQVIQIVREFSRMNLKKKWKRK